MRADSSTRCGGERIEIGLPQASSAVYPKTRSAPLFQVTMVPSSFWPMIASLEFSTIAAYVALVSSARLRCAISCLSSSLRRESSAVRCRTCSSSSSTGVSGPQYRMRQGRTKSCEPSCSAQSQGPSLLHPLRGHWDDEWVAANGLADGFDGNE